MLSLFSLIITVASAVGFYYLHKNYLGPFLSMLHYKLQGAGTIWNWKHDPIKEGTQNAIEKGNFYYKYIDYLRRNPKTKWIVENTGTVTPAPLLLADPKLLPEFLKKVYEFPKAPTPFTKGTLGDLMKGSIFFSEGDNWAWKRKILAPAFSFEHLEAMIPVYIQTFEQVFGELIRTNQLTDQLLIAHLTKVCSHNIGKFYFNGDYGTQKLGELSITEGIKALLTNLLMGAGPEKVQKDADSLKAMIIDIIKKRQASGNNGNDVLGLYLNLRDKNPEDPRLANEFISGEFIGLFQAGTDTVANLLNSSIYFLWKYPEVFAKVKEEINKEFSDLSKVNLESLNRMNYTTAFLKETMRCGGPGSNLLTRIALDDCEVDGFKIQKGTTVRVLNALWHPYEGTFSSPEVFDPERFLGSKKYEMVPEAYFPFSTGARTCLGERFAMNEAKTVLAMFVKTFKFTFPPKTQMILVPRFAYQPMTPFKVTLEKAN